MLIVVQTVSACLGVALVALLFARDPEPPPVGVYIAAAFFAGWGGTWLYARWRFGKGVTVEPSQPERRPPE